MYFPNIDLYNYSTGRKKKSNCSYTMRKCKLMDTNVMRKECQEFEPFWVIRETESWVRSAKGGQLALGLQSGGTIGTIILQLKHKIQTNAVIYNSSERKTKILPHYIYFHYSKFSSTSVFHF